MAKNKQLYYEIIEEDGNAAEEKSSDGEALPTAAVDVTPSRDPYRELLSAAKRIKRARFKVVPDNKGNIASLTLITFAIIMAGCIFLFLSKNRIGTIVIASIMIIAVAVAVAAMIVNAVQARKEYYCYYFKTDIGEVCISYVGSNATVYISSDRAYRIDLDGDNVYALDCKAYIDFFDGEGAGIASILAAKESDVELIDEGTAGGGVYRVKNGVGGGHDVYVDDGNIVGIVSSQPYKTDVVDPETGEAKIKTKVFEKTARTDDFTVFLPEHIKSAFRVFGLDIDGLIKELRAEEET